MVAMVYMPKYHVFSRPQFYPETQIALLIFQQQGLPLICMCVHINLHIDVIDMSNVGAYDCLIIKNTPI